MSVAGTNMGSVSVGVSAPGRTITAVLAGGAVARKVGDGDGVGVGLPGSTMTAGAVGVARSVLLRCERVISVPSVPAARMSRAKAAAQSPRRTPCAGAGNSLAANCVVGGRAGGNITTGGSPGAPGALAAALGARSPGTRIVLDDGSGGRAKTTGRACVMVEVGFPAENRSRWAMASSACAISAGTAKRSSGRFARARWSTATRSGGNSASRTLSISNGS